MNAAGRPIRFLASVVGGWMLLRIAMLWSEGGSLPRAIREVLPLPKVAEASPPGPAATVGGDPRTIVPDIATPRPARRNLLSSLPLRPRSADGASVQPASPTIAPFRVAAMTTSAPIADLAPEIVPAAAVQPSEAVSGWSVSGWLVARGGGVPGVAPGSQLGGSQAGVRVDRAVGRGLAMTARVAAPLQGRGAELSPGLAWQPGRLPLRAVVEYRIALDGGDSAPAIGISGGVSDLSLAAGFRLEGYAQAGAIARREVEGYADGAVRVARPLATLDRVRVDLGLGAWGAKQRDAARLDVGPSVALRVPVGTGGGARLQLDWRHRLTGSARPGSGPALTLGADL